MIPQKFTNLCVCVFGEEKRCGRKTLSKAIVVLFLNRIKVIDTINIAELGGILC